MSGGHNNNPRGDGHINVPDNAAEKKSLTGRDIESARHSDAQFMEKIEKKRTNRSSGSLAAEQERSLELVMGDGHVVSRKTATPVESLNVHNKGVQDFVDVEEKFRGIADGVRNTIQSDLAALAADPQATNKALGHTLQLSEAALMYLAKKLSSHDISGAVNDISTVAQKLVEANDKYSAMSQYDQGRLIGSLMPGFIGELPGFVKEARGAETTEEMLIKAKRSYVNERGERPMLSGSGGEWPIIAEREAADVVIQTRGKSCVSACGEMISEGRLKQADLIEALGTPTDTRRLAKHLGPEWKGHYSADTSVPNEYFEGGPFVADLRDYTIPGRRISDAHAVVVDGIDSSGNFMIRDPQHGTRYEMTRANFEKHWTGCAVFRELSH